MTGWECIFLGERGGAGGVVDSFLIEEDSVLSLSRTTTSVLRPIYLALNRPMTHRFPSVIHFVGVDCRPPEQKSIQSEPSSVGGQKKKTVSSCFFLTDRA